VNSNLLDRTAAAKYLGVSFHVLRKLALSGAEGGPPLVRITSRCVKYQRQQLDEWLRQRGAEPALFEFEASK